MLGGHHPTQTRVSGSAGVFTAGGQAALEAYDKVVGLGQRGPVRRRLHRQGALRGPGRRPLTCGPG